MSTPVSEQSVFLHAIGLSTPTERAAYLDEVCRDNPGLRAELDALVAAHDRLDARGFGAATFTAAGQTPTAAYIPPAPEAGAVIAGRYKLLEEIGEGGMGSVWMAEQTEPIQRRVAVKLIKPGMDSRQVVARFEAERQALALMDHPNIAKVLDGGATPDGRPYFVMELVKGTPITKFCDEKKLNVRERLELFGDVCRAVQHAHQKGIIHRDLKPSNVLVAPYDGRPVVKVIDFGVAKATGQKLTEATLFTGFGAVVGTPEYMSPEQAEVNNQDIDTRSDIYSLGVLLYELLTGSTPLTRKRAKDAAFLEVLRVIREEEPPRPSTRLSSTEELPSISAQRQSEPAKLTKLVRGELDWIVMKALEKDRNRRYETANGFAADVQRYLSDEAVQACPPSAGYRLRKFARRNRGRLVAASVLALAALVATSGIGWAVRDRAARQTRMTTQVELILADADRLMAEQKWPEALATAKRAESVFGGEDVEDGTEKKITEVIRDLQFVARLEEIRLAEIVIDGKRDYSRKLEDYRNAFRDFGIDLSSASPSEVVINRIGSHPISVPVAAALDHAAHVSRRIDKSRRDEMERFMELARRMDRDPVRDRIRAVWFKAETPEQTQSLRQLVDEVQVSQQPAGTLITLASTLGSLGHSDLHEQVLRQAQRAYPSDPIVNHNLGVILANSKGHQEAIQYYRAMVALRPRSPSAHNALAVALQETGNRDDAIACYRKAIELDPKFASAYNSLAVSLYDQKKPDEAIACFRKAIELDPNDFMALNNLGKVLRDRKELDEAIACQRKAIELDPKNSIAYNDLGVVLHDQKKLDEAINCYRKSVELDPKNAKAHYNLGNALRDLMKLDEAITCYRKAIELNSKSVATHINLGNVLCRQKKWDEAIACFRKAIELAPKFAFAHNNLGIAFRNQEKWDEAIACFRKAIELDPNDADAHKNLGIALHNQRKLDEAITCFRKVIELKPTVASAHNDLGFALRSQKKLDEAIACYRKAIELDPKYALAHHNLVDALKNQGKVDEAFACYRKAAELNPQDGAIHNALAWELCSTKNKNLRNPKEAMILARRAVQLDPKPWSHWNTLYLACYRSGEWKEALDACKQAIEREDKESRRCWNALILAMTLWQLGQKDEARKVFEGVAEEAKKYPWLGEVRQEAEQLLGIPALKNDK